MYLASVQSYLVTMDLQIGATAGRGLGMLHKVRVVFVRSERSGLARADSLGPFETVSLRLALPKRGQLAFPQRVSAR